MGDVVCRKPWRDPTFQAPVAEGKKEEEGEYGSPLAFPGKKKGKDKGKENNKNEARKVGQI
jgi:hypothetical protein